MANNKIGLNYFNIDTDRYQDIKIKRLKKDFSCSGIAIYDYILCEIYRVKGCFIVWDESTVFDVAEYFGIKESLVSEVVNYCGVVGLFDKALLTHERIITSLSIQKRYLEMCVRAKRSNCEIPKNIIIQEECEIIQEECHEHQEECTHSEGGLPQSKVKESKVKESSKKHQPDSLQIPFSSLEFLELWTKLIQMPKWKKKLPLSLQMSLDKLSKYDEEFSIELIKRAIEGNYQGLVFDNTDEQFLKWKTGAKNGYKHSSTLHKQSIENDERF